MNFKSYVFKLNSASRLKKKFHKSLFFNIKPMKLILILGSVDSLQLQMVQQAQQMENKFRTNVECN